MLKALQPQSNQTAQKLLEILTTFIPRVEQIPHQTIRRVIEGETVPASPKIVSLFKPHNTIIRRQKVAKR